MVAPRWAAPPACARSGAVPRAVPALPSPVQAPRHRRRRARGTQAHRFSGGPSASLRFLLRLGGELVDHVLGFLSPRVDAVEPVALRTDTDVHLRQSVAGALDGIVDAADRVGL